MTVFRYALLDLIRGRRRTFSAILGVTLAVTFLSGTFIAIDSSARAVLEGLLPEAGGDFSVSGSSGDPIELRETLRAHAGVENVSVHYESHVDEISARGDLRGPDSGLMWVDPANLPRFLEEGEVKGSLELSRGTIALTESLASDLRVGLGSWVTLRTQRGEVTRWLNLTVGALVTPSPPPYGGLALVHIQDVDWFREQLGRPDAWFVAEVWVDRDRFLDPYNIEGSRGAIIRFGRELQQAVVPYGASVRDNVLNALSFYEGQSEMQRPVFSMLSLPVLLLGLYLGAVGVDLGHAERRRELAVLKARGAGSGQVLGLLLIGAVLGGILATGIGLVAGLALSRLLLSIVTPFALETGPDYADVVLSAGTVVLVTAFSVAFMLLASYRSARRTARLPLVQTLRHVAPGETRIAYRPTVDIVLVSLGVVFFLAVWYVTAYPGTFFGFFAGFNVVVLIFFAPIFLIVGATRLLTRSTGRIYAWAARLWKPLTGNLHHVIHRNLIRNPRRASNVAVIIALGLGFGIFVFTLLGSTVFNPASSARAIVGADMSIRSPPTEDTGFAANLSALPAVAGVTRVRDLAVDVYLQSVPAFAVDPGTHFAVTQPASWYFDGLSVEAAASLLRDPGNVLASRALAGELFLEVGDRLSLSQEVDDPATQTQRTMVVNVTVAGFVRALPGTVFDTFSLPEALYASFETLEPFFASMDGLVPVPEWLLLDLHPGTSWQEAKSAILALGAGDVLVYEEELQRFLDDPVFRSTLGFISMEVAFMVAILTVGLGLILFATTLERDVEFAAMRARGASGRQAAGIVTGEAFSIMVVGLVIGVTIGLLVAYTFYQQVFLGLVVQEETLVPFLFEVPVEGLLLVGVAPLAMLLTSLLIAWRVARMNTAKVLKVRGG